MLYGKACAIATIADVAGMYINIYPGSFPCINDVKKLPQLFCPMQLSTVPVICLHNTGFNCIGCYSYYGGNIIRVYMYMLDFTGLLNPFPM